MEFQSNLARSQARAFVSLETIDTEITTAADVRDQSMPPLPLGTDKGLYVAYLAIQPKWKNSGTTATRNMEVQINLRGLTGPLSPDFGYPYDHPMHTKQPLFLGPKSAEPSEAIQINPNFARQIINNGDPHSAEPPMMFIWGRADYADVFGENHFIEWCYRVRFERHVGERVRAYFIQWGEYNRTDQDNPPQQRGLLVCLRSLLQRQPPQVKS